MNAYDFKTCLPSQLILMSLRCHMQAIERQAAAGVAEADALVLVMDGQQGLTGADEEVVSWLRRTHPKKPLLLAVNKCENPQKADLQVRPLSESCILCGAITITLFPSIVCLCSPTLRQLQSCASLSISCQTGRVWLRKTLMVCMSFRSQQSRRLLCFADS